MNLLIIRSNDIKRKFTQEELVIAVLQQRGSATTDLLVDLGIKCPSAVIKKLRKKGLCIISQRVKERTRKYLFPRLQARYTLITQNHKQGEI